MMNNGNEQYRVTINVLPMPKFVIIALNAYKHSLFAKYSIFTNTWFTLSQISHSEQVDFGYNYKWINNMNAMNNYLCIKIRLTKLKLLITIWNFNYFQLFHMLG